MSLAWEGTPRVATEPQPTDWHDLNAPAPSSRYAKLEEYDFSEEEINGADEAEEDVPDYLRPLLEEDSDYD